MTQRAPASNANGNTDQPIVFVVDDDASMRQALTRLFHSVRLRVEAFESATEFFQSRRPNVSQLSGARCPTAGAERSRLPGRTDEGGCSNSNCVHDRPWGYPDDGSGP